VAPRIRNGAGVIGHVFHFVEFESSCRRLGTPDFMPIADALPGKSGMMVILCAEAFPLPDSQTAAVKRSSRYKPIVPVGVTTFWFADSQRPQSHRAQ